METTFMRPSGRQSNALRPVTFTAGVSPYAEGSCLIECGMTKVMCTATVENRVPPFLRGKNSGWVTAEYGMLPRATHSRMDREAARGKQSGRTQEIQRLIGRSLRSVTDLALLGERQVVLDCDVLQADGGTRTAAINGAYVALRMALEKLVSAGELKTLPLSGQVAAVSCGIVGPGAVLDLDYAEDSTAIADMNFVMDDRGRIIEIQGTAEQAPFTEEQFQQMFQLAQKGIRELVELQRTALAEMKKAA